MPEENKSIEFGEQFDNQDFGLIDDGRYEVTIVKIEQRVSKKGTKYLNFTFEIRKDVEQKFKNRKLFYTIGQKDGDSCYDHSRVNKIVLTQKGLPTYKDKFSEFDEVLQYLQGINLSLEVETQFDDFSGKDVNIVKDWSFDVPTNKVATTDSTLSKVTTEDLPF